MSRSSLKRAAIAAAAILVSLLALGGCGSESNLDPLNPAPPAADGQFFRNASDAALPLVLGQGNGKAPKGGATPEVPEAESEIAAAAGAHSVSATIDGAVGGVVTNGRYRLVFPAGAFEGTETITIEDANNGYVECHLYPEGLTFSKRVMLQMSLRGTTGIGDSQATVYWHDPVAGTWVDIDGSYVAPAQSVVAFLEHFSDYRSGRAGW